MFMFGSRVSLNDLLSEQSDPVGRVLFSDFRERVAVSTFKKKKKKKVKVTSLCGKKKKPSTRKVFFGRAKAK